MSGPDLLPTHRRADAMSVPVSGGRDRRLDVLRGLAVLGISANHIWPLGSYGAQYTGYKFGHFFSFDFADVFLLVSGIVAGFVFFPVLQQHGLKACYRKAGRRVSQIWIAQVLCVSAALSIILFFERNLGATSSMISPFDQTALAAFSGNLLLYNPSYLLDVLPVYIMLLAALPLALVLLKQSVLLFLTLSVSVWAVAWTPVFLMGTGQIDESPIAFQLPYFIHPLAGQLFFFTGVVIGVRKHEIEFFLHRHRMAVLTGAIAFLLVTNYMTQVHWIVHHLNQKHFGGPLRLMELLTVLTILWSITRPLSSAAGISPIEACGRHALIVFAIISVSSVFFTTLIHWLDASRLIYGLCIAANVCFCLICGRAIEHHRALGQGNKLNVLPEEHSRSSVA